MATNHEHSLWSFDNFVYLFWPEAYPTWQVTKLPYSFLNAFYLIHLMQKFVHAQLSLYSYYSNISPEHKIHINTLWSPNEADFTFYSVSLLRPKTFSLISLA